MIFHSRLRQPSGLIPESGRTLPPMITIRTAKWNDVIDENSRLDRLVVYLVVVIAAETAILAALLLLWGLDHV